jgi:hypothetical protein
MVSASEGMTKGKGRVEHTFGIDICTFLKEELDEFFTFFEAYSYHQWSPSSAILNYISSDSQS